MRLSSFAGEEILSTVDEQHSEAVEESSESLMVPVGDILEAIWEHRRLILKATVVGLILGAAVAYLVLRNEYTATAQLMPPDQQSVTSVSTLNGLESPNVLPNIGGGLMSQRTPGSTIIGILSSDTLLDTIIDRMNLREEYHTKFYTDARKVLSKNTVMEEDKKSGIVSIEVTDRDPKRARDIAQAYIDELNTLLNTLNTSSAHRERVFLEDRLKTLKVELDKTSEDLSHFSSRTGTVNPQGQGEALIEAVARLQGELVTAESELSALKATYSADNVRVRSAQARVDELSGALRKMGGTSEASGTESTVQTGEPYPSLRQLPLLGATYADLARKMATEGAIYDTLTKQYEVAKVDEAKELPVARVLDAPKVPERKSSPHRLMITLGAAMLAGFFAILYVAVRKFWKLLPSETPLKMLLIRFHQPKATALTSSKQV